MVRPERRRGPLRRRGAIAPRRREVALPAEAARHITMGALTRAAGGPARPREALARRVHTITPAAPPPRRATTAAGAVSYELLRERVVETRLSRSTRRSGSPPRAPHAGGALQEVGADVATPPELDDARFESLSGWPDDPRDPAPGSPGGHAGAKKPHAERRLAHAVAGRARRSSAHVSARPFPQMALSWRRHGSGARRKWSTRALEPGPPPARAPRRRRSRRRRPPIRRRLWAKPTRDSQPLPRAPVDALVMHASTALIAVFSAGACAAEVDADATTSCVPAPRAPATPYPRRDLATPRQPVFGPTCRRAAASPAAAGSRRASAGAIGAGPMDWRGSGAGSCS